MERKINIACFKSGSRTAEVKNIWQWDYGQILRIQGLPLPTAVEIHFSLDEHGGEALRRIGMTNDGVTDVVIPDSMLKNESAYGDSYYFFAYIYLTDETSGNTEYKIQAKVSTRSKPEGFVSGGNDTFAEILKTVNEIAEDKVDIPVPAKVGQVLAVKATDESGKPTEFEATDPGGGVSDEKIAEAVGAYMEANPIEETDPTVPDWAKKPEKPTYTASEVGALPDTTKIPSKTSDLQNDSGFLTEHQDLSGYALKSEVPKSASDVGADAAGTAVAKVSEHNTASNAHNDIRLLVQGLTERLNALADSDDTTLDQMSEVVAYIKSNKSLIDAITTSKVNVSDIIDNLTTNVSNKPLSAAQGVKLKALIDAITSVELDESLSDNTKAAPAGMVGELKSDLEQLKQNGTSAGTGLSTEAIDKLEEVGNYLVYTTADGGSKWTELISILRNGSSGGGSGGTEVTLQSISATYTGGNVTVGTSVTNLTGITVTGTYSDGSTSTITGYTLSGEIVEGSNTITVSYGGKTTTFTVTGVAESSEVVNLFDKDTMVVENAFVQPGGGIYSNIANWAYAVILVDGDSTYTLQKGVANAFDSGKWGSLTFLNANDEILYILNTNQSNPNLTYEFKADYNGNDKGAVTFVTPSDCTSIRFTIKSAQASDATNTTMLETGDTCHDYVAYV